MKVNSFDHERPEVRPTVLFGPSDHVDPDPLVGANGRLIPGPKFSQKELAKLVHLAESQREALELFTLPTIEQLGRISLSATTGCWELPTYQDKKGFARYGLMDVRGITNASRLAHRTMYAIYYGNEALPHGHEEHLDHLCENKPCCYPHHLERVTLRDNTRRARRAKQHATGQLSIDLD
ncbi:MAG: hypothetical protein EOO17_03415 [Chloroflexi bacterium]|nr:MAG: hypothetical protein EOO17_03415 [Chloroflexota bacterium]